MTHFWQIFCQYYYPEITRKLPGPDFTKNYLPGPGNFGLVHPLQMLPHILLNKCPILGLSLGGNSVA